MKNANKWTSVILKSFVVSTVQPHSAHQCMFRVRFSNTHFDTLLIILSIQAVLNNLFGNISYFFQSTYTHGMCTMLACSLLQIPSPRCQPPIKIKINMNSINYCLINWIFYTMYLYRHIVSRDIVRFIATYSSIFMFVVFIDSVGAFFFENQCIMCSSKHR